MTDTRPPCVRCGRPIHDQAYACDHCGRALIGQLNLVAKLAGEAETTIARLDRIGAGGQRADPDPPLPVDLGAAADHNAAADTLRRWAADISARRGHPLPTVRRTPCPHLSCHARRLGRTAGPLCALDEPAEHPTPILAHWLAAQIDWLRHQPDAADAVDQLSDACRLIERVVDRPAERWYAGPCTQCGEPLNPVAGVHVIRCPECGTRHDPDECRRRLLVEAEDVWLTATRCAHYLTSLGQACTAAMVRGWAMRGRLAPHPDADPMGHPRYRLGSVWEVVLAVQADQRDRTIMAAIRAAELAEKRRRKETARAS